MRVLHPIDKDFSISSMTFLKERCENLFHCLDPENSVWLPDLLKMPNHATDVVMTGNFLRRILEVENWRSNHFRLWVIGSPVQKILADLFAIPKDKVSLIPRYDLVDDQSNTFHWAENLSSEIGIDLVYAGRITPSKKVKTLLEAVRILQKEHNVRLHLFGKFINEDRLFNDQTDSSYLDQIQDLIADGNWSDPPKFYGQVPSDSWTEQPYRNPVFVALSSLPFEDFSVSTAQAQEAGWPCLISDWGGLKDVKGTALKVPTMLFQKLTEEESTIQIDAENLAAHLLKIQEIPIQLHSETELQIPQTISKEELVYAKNRFLETYGQQIYQICVEQKKSETFTPQTLQFIRDYLKHFR